MKRFLLAVLALLLPSLVHAATVDLGISASSISFSDDLVAGSTIRIYGEVTNYGDTDVEGYVSFYQGSTPIDDSQVISVRAGGVPEEVYVDFVVPHGDFNIRAVIKGTDPEDENADNDVAMTKLFTPILDADGDGVEDGDDNCPTEENASQSDADGDGEGDACDDDDDDDGLTDEVEEEIGTDAESGDTDGDGVSDPDDAYPTDATRTRIEPVVVAPVATPAPAPAATASPTAGSAFASSEGDASETSTEFKGAAESGDAMPEVVPEPVVASELAFSSKAIFSYAHPAWNTYSFDAVTPQAEGEQYQWEFGDGVTSSRDQVEHTYAEPGEYTVVFRVTDASGSVSEDTAVVHVRFWTLQNRLVDVLLAFLALLLIAGVVLIVRLSRRPRLDAGADDEREDDRDRSLVVSEDARLDAQPRRKLTVRNLDDE